MNIQFPPREACELVWPKFVEWMSRKMGEDSWGAPVDTPVVNITFRLHEFMHCPFCGAKFNLELPIYARHGTVFIP